MLFSVLKVPGEVEEVEVAAWSSVHQEPVVRRTAAAAAAGLRGEVAPLVHR